METTVEDLQWDMEKLRNREQKLNKHLAEAMEQVRLTRQCTFSIPYFLLLSLFSCFTVSTANLVLSKDLIWYWWNYKHHCFSTQLHLLMQICQWCITDVQRFFFLVFFKICSAFSACSSSLATAAPEAQGACLEARSPSTSRRRVFIPHNPVPSFIPLRLRLEAVLMAIMFAPAVWKP